MVPPFVMTTDQWVTDPVEEFNLRGTGQAAASPDERHRTARVSSLARSPLLRSPLRQLRHVRAGGLRLSHGGVPSGAQHSPPPGQDECDLVFGKASERQLGLPASTADASAEANGMRRTEVVSRAALNLWLRLYPAGRKHLVKVSAQAIRCGIEERRVRLAKSQGAMVAEVLRRVFDDPHFGLDTSQTELGRRLRASHMRLLRTGAVEPA